MQVPYPVLVLFVFARTRLTFSGYILTLGFRDSCDRDKLESSQEDPTLSLPVDSSSPREDPSLFIAIVICRDSSIRQEAIENLKMAEGRIEVVWDASQIATLG